MRKNTKDVIITAVFAIILLFIIGYNSLKDHFLTITKKETIFFKEPPAPEYYGFSFKNENLKMNRMYNEYDIKNDTLKSDVFTIPPEMELKDLAKEYGTTVDNFQSINSIWESYIDSDILIEGVNYKEYSPNLLNELYRHYKSFLCQPVNKECEYYLKRVAPNSGILIFVKINIFLQANREGMEDIYFDPRIERLNSPRFSETLRDVDTIGNIMRPSYIIRSSQYTNIRLDAFTYLVEEQFKPINLKSNPLLDEFLQELDRTPYNPNFSPGMIRMLKKQDPELVLPINNDPASLNRLRQRYSKSKKYK